MSLLQTMRRGTQSTAMKVFFGIVVIVFVFWGVGAGTGMTSQTLAEVDGTRITDTQYQRQMRNITRSAGGTLDEDQLQQIGTRVLQDLIREEAMLQEAAALGIEVSEDEIARIVLQNDAFKASNGKFSSKLYERHLKRNGFTMGKYEELQRRSLTLAKLQQVVQGSVHPLESEVKQRFTAENTTLEMETIHLDDALLLPLVEVDQTALDAYLATSEEELKAQYEADFERLYNSPRKAEIRIILLRSDLEAGDSEEALKTKMTEILAEARSGIDFDQLARKYSEDLSAGRGGAMGAMSEPQLDPALAAAVFVTDPGGITDVVETGRGLQIVKVESITEAEVVAFDDVKTSIARDKVAQAQVGPFAGALAEKILTQWKADQPIDTILAENGLSIDPSGAFPVAQPPMALSTARELVSAAQTLGEPGVVDGVFPSASGRILGKVTQFVAPDETDYGSAAGEIRARMGFEARQRFTQTWTEDLVARADVVQHYFP